MVEPYKEREDNKLSRQAMLCGYMNGLNKLRIKQLAVLMLLVPVSGISYALVHENFGKLRNMHCSHSEGNLMLFNIYTLILLYIAILYITHNNRFDRLCGLVVRVLDYRCRGPGFDSQALPKKK
jgi:hypothetical protein